MLKHPSTIATCENKNTLGYFT